MKPEIKTHLFEDQQLTLRQIRERVPCLGDHAIKTRLRAGITTVRGMMDFNGAARTLAGSRRGARMTKLRFGQALRNEDQR